MIEESHGDISAVLCKVMGLMKYIPPEGVKEIAKQTGVSEAHLFHLVTTGRAFALSPSEHQVSVCAGTGCAVKDKSGNLETIEKLIAGAGPERVFSKKVRCLGCCESGPLCEIDGVKVPLNAAQARIETLLKG